MKIKTAKKKLNHHVKCVDSGIENPSGSQQDLYFCIKEIMSYVDFLESSNKHLNEVLELKGGLKVVR